MKRYYVMINGQQQGPYTMSQIKEMGLDSSTYVFNNELSSQWLKLSDVPEFNNITPPPFTPPPITSKSNVTNNNQTQVPPKNWLLESILVTIFCCIPFGIVGILSARKVETLFYQGDSAGAQKASEDAKKWTIVSLICGIVAAIIGFIFGVLGEL